MLWDYISNRLQSRQNCSTSTEAFLIKPCNEAKLKTRRLACSISHGCLLPRAPWQPRKVHRYSAEEGKQSKAEELDHWKDMARHTTGSTKLSSGVASAASARSKASIEPSGYSALLSRRTPTFSWSWGWGMQKTPGTRYAKARSATPQRRTSGAPKNVRPGATPPVPPMLHHCNYLPLKYVLCWDKSPRCARNLIKETIPTELCWRLIKIRGLFDNACY